MRALGLLNLVLALAGSSSGSYPQDWVFFAQTTGVARYGLDHGGWAGMTTASLVRYDRQLRFVRVVRASKTSYCIEVSVGGRSAFVRAHQQVRAGTCAHPGAVATVHTYEHAAAVVRAAVPALEAWDADRGGYTGATLARLQSYDREVKAVVIVRATKTTYCLEGRAGIWLAFKNGPAAPIRPGRCPR